MPYDYGSVMHLGSYAFTKNSIKTIVPLKSIRRLSFKQYPTALDMFQMNIMYCEGNTYSTTNYINIVRTCVYV